MQRVMRETASGIMREMQATKVYAIYREDEGDYFVDAIVVATRTMIVGGVELRGDQGVLLHSMDTPIHVISGDSIRYAIKLLPSGDVRHWSIGPFYLIQK
jgi:hypothetical protein